MPANLPAEARHKWSEVSLAKTPQQKLRALEEFLSLVPKHKGTAKLCAHVRRQMALLRREIERRRRKRGRGPSFFVEKEGAGQVVILGLTNVGRSSLLASLTNAKVRISSYPYTTRHPTPGMLQFEDIQLQIVEAPAVMEGASARGGWGLQTLTLARNADALILMVDLTEDPCRQLSILLKELEGARILVHKPKGRVEIERAPMGTGLRILLLGRLVDCQLNDVKELLRSYRILNATVRIYGEASLDDVEDAIFESTVYRPAVIVANKLDLPGAKENLRRLMEFVGGRMRVIPTSCVDGTGLKELGAALFEALEIIRIYTKQPGERSPSPTPFVLKRGATVEDLAKRIHSDFHKRFLYARVWSKRFTFNPRRVGLSFRLDDGDVVELHAR